MRARNGQWSIVLKFSTLAMLATVATLALPQTGWARATRAARSAGHARLLQAASPATASPSATTALAAPGGVVPRAGDCSRCDGGISLLTLRYTGALPSVLVTVTQTGNAGHGEGQPQPIAVFSGTVPRGGTFTLAGQDKHGTLGASITIDVNGALDATVATDCRTAVGPGLVAGDFTVVDGVSREGSRLCPVVPPPPVPVLQAALTYRLLIDADSSHDVSAGDTLRYTAVIANPGPVDVTGAVFHDAPALPARLVAGSVTTTQGTVAAGNSAGDSTATVNLGTVPKGGSVTVTFDVMVLPLPAGTIALANQGFASGDGLPGVPTDDPGTPEVDDPTHAVTGTRPLLHALLTVRDRDRGHEGGGGEDEPGRPGRADASRDPGVNAGDVLHYTATIQNRGNAPATGVAFLDALASSLHLRTDSVTTSQGTIVTGRHEGDTSVAVALGTIAPGGAATVQFDVRIDRRLPAGTRAVANQGTVTSAQSPGGEGTDDPATPAVDDATVSPLTSQTLLAAVKYATLLTNLKGDGRAGPGDVVRYLVLVANRGGQEATGVRFADAPDPNSPLQVGTAATSLGAVTTGNTPGDSAVNVDVGPLAAGQGAAFAFDAAVSTQLPPQAQALSNQGTVTADGQSPLPTDDPTTAAAGDPTVTPLAFTAAIGDFVWNDLNGNGIQDAGEPGLAGVAIQLLDGSGNPLAATTSDAGGAYRFANLPPGTYVVQFTAPPGLAFSPKRQGNDPTRSSAADPQTGRSDPVLLNRYDNLTVDAGFTQHFVVGRRVWEDLNGNGIQDPGEPGIGGVTVYLLDGTGAVTQTATSGADGSYGFTGMVPGTYYVEFVPPAGFVFTLKGRGADPTLASAADPASGDTGPLVLTPGATNLTANAGLYRPVVLSGFVWDDANGNGIQDRTEQGRAGIDVVLLDPTGKVLQAAFTDPGGAYRFAGLAPGSYALRVQRPSGLTFSPQGQGGDPARDSDVDPATGMTPATTFASGGTQAADAGLFQAVSAVTTSPVNGEQDVAVDRPIVLRLSGPLGPSAVVDGTKVSVAFGGSVVPLRVHLSPDRRVVTLFHDQPFPASARMRLTVVGDGLPNVFGNDLDADGDGKPGGVALIDFNTLNLTTVPNTVVCGSVYASQLDTSGPGDTSKNTPLTGVTISVQGAPALGTMTDANGDFCLSPAPAGRFFVLVDGHTATNGVPPGNYYPSVGKAWVSIPGQQVSIGEVYLPLIPSGTLQPVSQTADTTITFAPSVTASFPQFAGMRVTIPADSLYSNDGSRGGMVGIAPVPPDRLPAPLPPGLHFPLVITVQTNGPDNFDVPAPVCFPNLTDPTTGITLAPGSKSALWSFNHHTGNFEIVGPMTVSADGKTVCTDPGVGIVGPSWHGTQPGTGPSPMPAPKMPKPKDPKCDKLDLVAKAASLAKDIITGAARFSPFLQKIQCAVSAVSTAAGLINDFRNAAAQNSILCGALIDLKVRFNQVTDLLDKCLPGPEEITAAQQACMDLMNAVSALKDLTAFGSCSDSEVLQLIAEIVSDAATAANTVITLKQQALGLIDPRKALDQLLGLLVEKVSEKACPGNRAGTRPGAGGAAAGPADVPVDPATAALLNSIADNLTTETASAGQLQPPVISSFMDQQATAIAANDSFLRGFVDGSSQPIANPVYVSITTGTFVQRFRTEGTFQAILPPNAEVTVAIYDPLTKYVDVESTRTNDSGQLTRFGEWVLTPELNPVDSDNDGLSDLAESIVGTDPHNPDTDGKGIGDAEEVLEGLFPLNGRQVTTGVIAAINIPGQAVDICAVNNVAMVAAEGGGLIVFNVFSGTNPVILAQVATPAPAVSVACAGNLAAVATFAGLSIVDLTDPPAAKIVHQVTLPAGAQRVAAAGGLAYVASGTQVVLVDLTSGTVLDTLSYSQDPINDFSVAGDFVYFLTATGGVQGSHTIYKIPIDVTLDPPAATLRISGLDHPTFGRMHIFAGGGLVYVGSADDNASNQAPGVEIIRDDGNALTLIGPPSPITAFDVAVNGSGLALFTGADPGLTGSAKVGVLDVRDPTVTSSFLTAYGLPGPAQEIAIYDATGYVADDGGGLQVINYQPYDTRGVPPTVSLTTNFSPGVASEGALMRVTANVQDDVQVRNVEFFVDGVRVLNNGTFPFELRFTTPLIAQQPSLTLHACAWDTGGNHTCTPETAITLVPDASPPRVTAAAPNGNVAGNPITAVAATFNKLIDPATLTASSFQLVSAGPDGVLGTPDDVAVGGGVTSFRPDIATGFLTFASPLAPGLYQGVVTGVVDLAGNQMAAPFSWTFTILPPPSVAIDSPAAGSTVIQGSSLVISVTAVGPVPILSVDFLVDGVVTRTAFSPPYRATVLVPATATSLTLGATANFTGKLSVQAVPVVVQAIPDPGTTVVGRVVDQGANPVAGATVTIVFNPSSGGVSAPHGGSPGAAGSLRLALAARDAHDGRDAGNGAAVPEAGAGPGPNPGTFTGVSQSDGTFSIPGVPTIDGPIGADASAPVAGSATYLVGSAIPKSPVAGGTTDLGTFTLKPNAACYTAVLTYANCSTGPVTGTLTLQDSMGRTSQVTADATGRFCAIVDSGLQYFLRRQEDVTCTNNSVQHACASGPFQLSDPGTTGQCGGATCEDHGTLNFFCASS